MIQETAIVSNIKDGYADLIIDSQSACGACASKSSCGQSSILNSSPKQKNVLRIYSQLSLQAGDTVIIGIKPNQLLLATVMMYILPLIVFIIFAVIGKYLGGEHTSILAGLFGLFCGIFFLRKYVSQNKISNQFQPKILNKVVSIKSECT
ncbi:MAG: SoxR reducing system RseC family protein [Cocleimonas sp.]